MAKAFHDVASIKEQLRQIELVATQIRGVVDLLEKGRFDGRLYIQGEVELGKGMTKIALWGSNASFESIEALRDPAGYKERTEIEAAAVAETEAKSKKKNGKPQGARKQRQ